MSQILSKLGIVRKLGVSVKDFIICPLEGSYFLFFQLKSFFKGHWLEIGNENVTRAKRPVILGFDFCIFIKNYDIHITTEKRKREAQKRWTTKSWTVTDKHFFKFPLNVLQFRFAVKMWHKPRCLPTHMSLPMLLENRERAWKLHYRQLIFRD